MLNNDPKFENQEDQPDSEMVRLKPDTPFSPAFQTRLREELNNKARDIKIKNTFSFEKLTNIIYMKKFTWAFGGLAVVVLAVLVAYPQYLKQGSPGQSASQLLGSKLTINSVPERAFGDLNSQPLRNQSGGGGGGMGGTSAQYSTNAVAPDMASPQASSEMAVGMGGGGTSSIGIMPPYYPTYTFSYKGDDITDFLKSEQPVFRRVNSLSTGSAATQLLRQFSLGLLDFSKFEQPKLQNFTVVEDKEYGYIINVDLTQGTVNIYQNWEKWPHPEIACQSEECYRQYRPEMSDIPGDQAVIDIAEGFVKSYGISLDGYGAPIVNNDWRVDYAASADKLNYYIPDSLTVVYPLRLDGKSTLDQGGNPTGLMLNVDVRAKKVTNVYGLSNKQFDQSNYKGETDVSRIIKLAEQGGWQNYLPLAAENGGSNSATVELGTPTVELVQFWKYDLGAGQELFAPALVFPVKTQNLPGVYLPKKVIIPLVKELLDQNQPPIMIMEGSVPPSDPVK